jgi:hypothetical protein
MDRTQSVPNIQVVTVVEPPVGRKGTKAKNGPAYAFQDSRHPRPTTVTRPPGVVRRVESRRRNPRTRLDRNGRYIQDVIQVPMGNDDSANRLPIPSALTQCLPQKKASTDESGIQQIQALRVTQHVEAERRGPHLEKVVA